MMRITLLAVVLTLVVICAGAIWYYSAASNAPFILPGATQLVVDQHDLSTTTISYHADAQTWRVLLTRQLSRAGWDEHSAQNTGARLPQWAFITWYTRENWLGILGIMEQAHLAVDMDDPTDVTIEIHRGLEFGQAAPYTGS